MALQYIIDGYNVIKSSEDGSLSAGTLQQQRERLIALIAEMKPHGSPRNGVAVIFDSSPDAILPDSAVDRYVKDGVVVIFSAGRTADDKITELARNHKNPGEIIVVTDDRGIRRQLGGIGVKFMSANEFSGKLTRPLRPFKKQGKIDSDSEDEINEEFKDYWLKK